MKVVNLTSPRTGAKVANQFEIIDGDKFIFQSYETIIAIKQGRNYIISEDYNYSNTTSKYLKQWLLDWGWHSDEVEQLKEWLKKHNLGDVSTEEFNGIGGGLTIEYVSWAMCQLKSLSNDIKTK